MKIVHCKTDTTVPSYLGSVKKAVFIVTLIVAAWCAVLLWINSYPYFLYSGRNLAIEMKTSVAGHGQIYFDQGNDYQEKESHRFEIRATSDFETYKIDLPETAIKSIRFDPIDEKGLFEIKSVTIYTRDDKWIWEGEELSKRITPLQQITVQNKNTIFTGFSTGKDPNFHVRGFTVPENRHTITRTLIVIFLFTAGVTLFGFLCFLVIEILIRSGHLYQREKTIHFSVAQKISLGLLVFSVLIFYLWTATSNFKPFQFSSNGVYNTSETLYHDLSEAFLQGRLSLPIEPSRELLSLQDPYDPEQNKKLRLHDASLYRGSYYLYFGPAPVFATFIPWRLMTGNPMPHNLAASIFAGGGFVCCVLILIVIVRGTKLKISYQCIIIALLLLGICNKVPFVLRGPFMYEVASVSAYFWSMLSLFFIFSFLLLDHRKIIYLGVSSLCFGLAIASRFSYVYSAVIFIVPLWEYLGYHAKIGESFKKMAVPMLIIGMPLISIVGMLLLYNYFRFGNFLEFGLKYQLGILRPLDYPFLSIQNTWINNYLHFFHGHIVNGLFPFFHIQPINIPENIPIPSYYPLFWMRLETQAGILTNIPFLWTIIPAWLYLKILTKNAFSRPIQYIASILLLGTVTNWIVVSCFSYSQIRYVLDFLPMLLLLSCLIYWMIYDHFHDVIVGRAIVQCLVILTVIYSVLSNIGMSIEAFGLFKEGNPEFYTAVEHFFDFIPQMIRKVS